MPSTRQIGCPTVRRFSANGGCFCLQLRVDQEGRHLPATGGGSARCVAVLVVPASRRRFSCFSFGSECAAAVPIGIPGGSNFFLIHPRSCGDRIAAAPPHPGASPRPLRLSLCSLRRASVDVTSWLFSPLVTKLPNPSPYCHPRRFRPLTLAKSIRALKDGHPFRPAPPEGFSRHAR